MQIIYIGIGGFLGAISRFLVAKFFNNYFPDFPVGTLVVNVSGSFLIGLIIYSAVSGRNISPEVRDFATIGFIGAFTTMSAFAYETFRLGELSEFMYFGLNVFLNVFLSLLAVYIGKELAVFLVR